MKFKHSLLALGLASAITAPAQATMVMIDDFNIAFGTGVSVTADTFSPGPNSAVAPITGANVVMDGQPGWSRTITAELIAGVDQVETIVCDVCQAGHVNAEIPATAEGQFIYDGGTVDFMNANKILFDYIADLDGIVVNFLVNGSVAASSGPLAATLTNTTASAMLGAGNFSSVNHFAIQVVGTQAADFTIDTVRAVPVPATLALFLGGLAGLGMRRKATKA